MPRPGLGVRNMEGEIIVQNFHRNFMKLLHVFDEPIIFEENGGVLQLRRLSQPMTPFPTAFDVD